jgi:hypothetical protein
VVYRGLTGQRRTDRPLNILRRDGVAFSYAPSRLLYLVYPEGELQVVLSADLPHCTQELQAFCRYAHDHDVEQGERYDARSAAINVRLHHLGEHPR